MLASKTVCVIVLAAFANALLASCTTTVCRSIEGLAREQQKSQGEDKIVGLVLKDKMLPFDSLGGIFDKTTATVAGITVDGRPTRLGFNRIRLVQVSSSDIPQDSLLSLDSRATWARFSHSYLIPIREIELKSAYVPVSFAGRGGWLYPAHRIVVGNIGDDTLVQYPFDDVEYAVIERLDIGKTIGHTLGYAALLGICVTVIITFCGGLDFGWSE